MSVPSPDQDITKTSSPHQTPDAYANDGGSLAGNQAGAKETLDTAPHGADRDAPTSAPPPDQTQNSDPIAVPAPAQTQNS